LLDIGCAGYNLLECGGENGTGTEYGTSPIFAQ
jgi:hypothetical protein